MSELTKKVYYHDTDTGGVVYYANYLKYLEEARTEFLLSKGVKLKELTEAGIWFVVRRVEIDYKSPARYADSLIISTEITRIKNASWEFGQAIKRGEDNLVEAKTKMVCVDAKFSPRAIPEEVVNCLGK